MGSHRGGTETHIRELALSLATRGHEIHILTTRGKELERYRDRINVWYVSPTLSESYFSKRLIRLRAAVFILKSFMLFVRLRRQGHNFDALSVHFALEAYLATLVRLLFKTPFMFVFEGYSMIEGTVGGEADLRIAILHDIEERCHKIHGFTPFVIPVGVDIRKFKPPMQRPRIRQLYCKDGEKLVLTVCQLIPRKDTLTLVRAANIVREKNDKIRFLIVGDNGPERDAIARKIHELSLDSVVFLNCSADYDELPQYYQAADIFAHLTLFEKFGIVLVEAMASGVPIVSTMTHPAPEVKEAISTFAQPQDPEDLAAKILGLLNEPSMMNLLGVRGIRDAVRFDWNNIASEYEDLMRPMFSGLTEGSTRDHFQSLVGICLNTIGLWADLA